MIRDTHKVLALFTLTLAACNAPDQMGTPGTQTNQNPLARQAVVNETAAASEAAKAECTSSDLLGSWRPRDTPSSYMRLQINKDCTWTSSGGSHEPSSGTWNSSTVESSDGDFNGCVTKNYHPQKKLTLNGYNNDKSIGPIDSENGSAYQIWIIYYSKYIDKYACIPYIRTDR